MRLFTRLTFKLTLVLLFVNRGDGFMFSAWLRSTTEQNLSTLGQYKYQNYAMNEAQSAAGVSRYAYAPKKDSGTANVVAIAAAAPPHQASYAPPTDKNVIGAYNNQRTGISPPPKYDKPWNVFDAVVVHSIPSAASAVPPSSPSFSYVAIPAHNYPYLYYRDEPKVQPAPNTAAATFATTTQAPQKSVHVELNYKDDAVVEKMGENVVLNRKTPSVAQDSVQPTVESSVSNTATAAAAAAANASSSPIVSDSSSKIKVPDRPIKLLGPHAVYAAPAPSNLTFASQFFYAPTAADIRYFPYPFLRSSLVAPFLYKNTPRAVSERSEIAPPPPPPATQITNPKLERPICENCVLPSALPFKIYDTNENVFQKPCAHESTAAAASHPNGPISPFLKSSNMAYILVPSQIIRNRAS